MEMREPLIKPGRPRLNVDFALVLRLRDEEHLGWTLGAQQYLKRTNQWISRDTFKRRYLEAKDNPEPVPMKAAKLKVIIKSPLDELAERWAQKLKGL